jgi:hypothetical protein
MISSTNDGAAVKETNLKVGGGHQFLGISWKYAIPAVVAGAFVSQILTGIFYTAAMPLLFNAQYQSKKVLDVYQTIQPLPLLTTNIGIFLAGSLIVAITRNLVFTRLYNGIPGIGIRKGLAWGLVVWLIMIIYAEFYTAVNLLGEPLYLAVFESLLQLPVFLAEGAVVAIIYRRAWT